MLQNENVRKEFRTSGMSLIEIIIVITIIGLFVGIGGPMIYRALGGARDKKTKVLLNGLKATLVQYQSDTGQYPLTLRDLMVKPSDVKAAGRWQGPYIDDERELQDAWGNEFAYRRNQPGAGKKPFELYSWGPDGEGSEEGKIDVWNL